MNDKLHQIHHPLHLVRHINAKTKKQSFLLFNFFLKLTCEQHIQPGHCRPRQCGTPYLNVSHSNKSVINPTIIPAANNINTPINRSRDNSLF